jgi:hypothetical protein
MGCWHNSRAENNDATLFFVAEVIGETLLAKEPKWSIELFQATHPRVSKYLGSFLFPVMVGSVGAAVASTNYLWAIPGVLMGLSIPFNRFYMDPVQNQLLTAKVRLGVAFV